MCVEHARVRLLHFVIVPKLESSHSFQITVALVADLDELCRILVLDNEGVLEYSYASIEYRKLNRLLRAARASNQMASGHPSRIRRPLQSNFGEIGELCP